MFYLTNIETQSRTAGPFVNHADAETRRLSYPNPRALSIVEVSADSYKHCSDYAEVGEMIQWESAEGVMQGRVDYINRDLPTADPRENADYYSVAIFNAKREFNGRSSYLNSNMMKMLNVQNISAGVQKEMFSLRRMF